MSIILDDKNKRNNSPGSLGPIRTIIMITSVFSLSLFVCCSLLVVVVVVVVLRGFELVLFGHPPETMTTAIFCKDSL